MDNVGQNEHQQVNVCIWKREWPRRRRTIIANPKNGKEKERVVGGSRYLDGTRFVYHQKK